MKDKMHSTNNAFYLLSRRNSIDSKRSNSKTHRSKLEFNVESTSACMSA